MDKKVRKWLDAVSTFEEKINAKVSCPECEIGYLYIKDVLFDDDQKIDRYMICDNCGKYNVATMINSGKQR